MVLLLTQWNTSALSPPETGCDISSSEQTSKLRLNQFVVLAKTDPDGLPRRGLNYAHIDTE
jgi:hypothetical protein